MHVANFSSGSANLSCSRFHPTAQCGKAASSQPLGILFRATQYTHQSSPRRLVSVILATPLLHFQKQRQRTPRTLRIPFRRLNLGEIFEPSSAHREIFYAFVRQSASRACPLTRSLARPSRRDSSSPPNCAQKLPNFGLKDSKRAAAEIVGGGDGNNVCGAMPAKP